MLNIRNVAKLSRFYTNKRNCTNIPNKSRCSLKSYSQKPFIVGSSLKDENIMTKALVLAKYAHWLYDRNEELNSMLQLKGYIHSVNQYHYNFSLGVNSLYGKRNTTINCLIIEGHKGMPVARIHTPKGPWTIVGNNNSFVYKNHNGNLVDSDFLFGMELFKHIECVKICPKLTGVPKWIFEEYPFFNSKEKVKENENTVGPFWLVKSIHGIPVACPNIELLPDDPESIVWEEKTQEKNIEKMKEIYLRQLQKFFTSWMGYDEITQIKQWIEKGYISDINGYAKDMIKPNADFEYFEKFFLNKRLFLNKSYIGANEQVSMSRAHRIFRMIYCSNMNDNSLPEK
jgi:hypothetical protein